MKILVILFLNNLEIKFDDKNLAAYPNPFQNNFYIHIPVEVSHATLQIHDVTGRLLYEEKNFNTTPQSDALISLPQYKGVMIISVKDDANGSGGNRQWNTVAAGL